MTRGGWAADVTGTRVLVDAVAASSGGGAVRVAELARTLPGYRPLTRFTFVARGEVRDRLRATNTNLSVLSPPRSLSGVPLRLAWEHVALPRLAHRDLRPDVVLAPFNVAPLWWPGAIPPTVVIVSNLAPYSREVRRLYRGTELARLHLLRALTDATLAKARRVFLLSEQAFDLIDDRLLHGKAELLPMAPPPVPAVVSPEESLPAHGYLLVAGDLLRYKGIETAIRALALLPRSQQLPLAIAGRALDRPYVRQLRRLADAAGVAHLLVHLGPVGHERLLGLMRRSLACVVPSRFENPSRVPVEAMASGAPLLVSDIPVFRATCGDAAVFFEVDRAEHLAYSIARLLNEPCMGDDLRSRGRRHLATLHVGSASERIGQAIDEIADGASG